MRYFDNGNKLTQDECAIQAKDRDNQNINMYNTFNFYDVIPCDQLNKLQDFAMENPNLTYRIGYGFASPCVIDNDSKMRMGADITHGHERRNLCTRNFVAGPSLNRGGLEPDVESALINGTRTFSNRDCHKIAETDLGYFAPLDPCVEKYINGASRYIDDDIRIGRPSKEVFLATRSCSK